MNKKYRPFKTFDEFYDFTGAHSYLREIYIVFRNKKTHCVYDESIFSISYNEKDELLTINRFSVQELFDNFEFYSFGKWVPFGVEVKDEDWTRKKSDNVNPRRIKCFGWFS